VTIIGYARASAADQDTSIQEDALRAAGCDIIQAEKCSGTTTSQSYRGLDRLKLEM
jgi:DNA invertase Pin-like site-specific DNA recombinase